MGGSGSKLFVQYLLTCMFFCPSIKNSALLQNCPDLGPSSFSDWRTLDTEARFKALTEERDELKTKLADFSKCEDSQCSDDES